VTHAETPRRWRLAIVSPMANEADNAERFIRELLAVTRRFPLEDVAIFVVLDTVSRDGTRELLTRLAAGLPELRVIWAPENRGVVDAYVRGYRAALSQPFEWILEIDAGFSHQPAEAARFLQRMAGEVDCVFATRFARGGRFLGGLSRRFLVSRGGGLLARLLLGVPLSDMTSGFQLFSRAALEQTLAPGLMSRGPFFQAEMKYRCARLRLREVPITYVPTAQAVRRDALLDALTVLSRLFWGRLTGRGVQVPAAAPSVRA